MVRTICTTFPFMVCVCWFVTFALHTRHNDSAKRVLTVFLATCSVLYFCHAVYFNQGSLPVYAEALWGLCSLSVYPLYYIYITHLTCHPLSRTWSAMCLLPGMLVALAMLVFANAEADNARKVLNGLQVFCVMYFGYKRLQVFDKEIANVYADTEGRDTSAVKTLLIAFVVTSLLSAVANAVGKQSVASSDWLLLLILFPFAILLYALSYIGYTRDFTLAQYVEDTIEADADLLHFKSDASLGASSSQPTTATSKEPDEDAEDALQAELEEVAGEVDESELGKKIEMLLVNDYFLTKNLKITDVAREVGACRTYVSNYINKRYDSSFSDFVNGYRIECAKRLLQSGKEQKMSVVSEMSGFSSEQSFYRNFKKFVGMTPAEWLSLLQQQESHS